MQIINVLYTLFSSEIVALVQGQLINCPYLSQQRKKFKALPRDRILAELLYLLLRNAVIAGL